MLRWRVLRRLILGAAVLLAVWSVIVAVTGGVDAHVLGVAIRSRDPFRALVASVALFLVLAVRDRAWLTARLDRAGAVLRPRAVFGAPARGTPPPAPAPPF